MVFRQLYAPCLLALGLLLPACSSTSSGAGPAVAGPLEPWQGVQQQLFDDAIDPSAVGMSVDGAAPETDHWLRPRAEAAEVAARVRVQTVTRNAAGAHVSYVVNLQVGKPTLVPARLEADSFELQITPETPAFGIVRTLNTKLGGRTFVGFVKRFAGPQGPELHWHLSADTPAVVRVVQQFGVLENLAGR